MTVSAADLASWRTWVGRREIQRELLHVSNLRRFAAAIGESLDVERVQPSLAHWAFFLPVAPADAIGEDGHPLRGGFLPPVTLPRRMFAAGAMRFLAPLILDQPAKRSSEIVSINHKVGRTGDLVLLNIEHRIQQAGIDRVIEQQTLVYREQGASMSPPPIREVAVAEGDEIWQPRSVDLFRFSAATFNGHRIHYDLPYAVEEEAYPGLVVHGPFTATKLYALARRCGHAPTTFGFRALAPIFAGQPVTLKADDDNIYRAVRADGTDAMVANIGS